MEKLKKIAILACLFLLSVLLVSAAENTIKDEYALYTKALEKLVADDIPGAMALFRELLTTYPDTELRVNAQKYIDMYEKKLDQTGIISFYIGWLATNNFIATTIPILFDNYDPLILSSTSIIGIGSGLFTAWVLSDKKNLSLGQDIWIEFAEVVSVANSGFLMLLARPVLEPLLLNLYDKITLGSVAATALAGRLLAYYAVKDKTLSADKIWFIANSYFWAHAYLWPTLVGIFNSYDMTLNMALGIVIPDAAALGALYLADKIGWSFNRTGLVSLGGAGGALIGSSINMGLTTFMVLPVQATIGIVLASTLTGQVITALLTREMDSKQPVVASAGNKTSFTIIPLFTGKEWGFQGQVRF